MITISNGIVLKGLNLVPSKENILIDDGCILEISPDIKEGKILDATNCIICPSFLNAHTHIGDSIIKDEGDGLSLSEIVKPPNGIKHKALESADENSLISSMQDAMWTMLKSGTTHFIDYREGGIKGVKLLKKASENIPINPIILGRDNSFYGDNPDLHKVKINARKLLKIADGLAPSGFGEISQEVANIIVDECDKKGKISSIHAAESENAQRKSIEKKGKSEIELSVDSGFKQIVHVTIPVKNDIDLLKNSNSSITLCPRANATLAVGTPPIKKILKTGLKPLIGTDNLMVNTPNIFRELEYTLKIMRAQNKHYVPPRTILEFATTNICAQANNQLLNSIINKTIITEGNTAQLMVVKKLSKNNYLSLINRTETEHIKYLFNKNIIKF
ncbi:MAG: amidohydrolase family protein [Methanobacteriaceae archaeon]|jgi:cytosine/adenosine deaminase-related metal-dependent hydrolase|uniref:amidohydrolase family protein n=1 Tax=unclassified Methanobrevibacter TaxID=2638681 RepID=UPI003762F4F4|nr:amidohydrolase family protein [Methanobacteriaceae archaeon]MDD4594611.1 amidohydrolase family protein [Methanobacteriaceae archaeon]